MDAAQFELLLKAITLNNEKLVQAVTEIPRSSSTSNPLIQGGNTVTYLQNFDAFDGKKETFKQYRERFEIFLKIRNISTEREEAAKLLLSSIGAGNYTLIKSLSALEEPTALSYLNLIEILEKHLSPTPNYIIERHRFLSRVQDSKESIAEYIAALKSFVPNCKFVCECGRSVADLFLHAQFVRGLINPSVREQLFLLMIYHFKQQQKRRLRWKHQKAIIKKFQSLVLKVIMKNNLLIEFHVILMIGVVVVIPETETHTIVANQEAIIEKQNQE